MVFGLRKARKRQGRHCRSQGACPAWRRRSAGSFRPRVTGGPRTLEADHQIEAWKRYKKAMDAVGQSLRRVIFYGCIAGEASNDWARRNAMIPQADLAVLRLALAELAHHYGLCKLPAQLMPIG